MFVLRSSKTHDEGDRPQTIKIDCEKLQDNSVAQPEQPGITRTCPFETLCHYLKIRPGYKAVNEQFFIFRDGSLVTPVHMRTMLKSLLEAADFNTSIYTVHSLRGEGFSYAQLRGVG